MSNEPKIGSNRISVNQVNIAKAPTVKVRIKNLNGTRTFGEAEALLDYGADVSIADMKFLKRMGLNKKDLKKSTNTKIWAANQSEFRKHGILKAKIWFGNNAVDEESIIVQEDINPSLIIGWNASRLLRNDLDYPKSLDIKQVNTTPNQDVSSEKNKDKARDESSDMSNPSLDFGDEMLPENPSREEIEEIKQRLFEKFKDVFSDGEGTLQMMNCAPSVIDLKPEAKPIRLSTARTMAYGYREEAKKELDKMVTQGVIKPVGDKATEWCNPMVVVRKSGGGIRICVDLSKLNKFVRRPAHPGPSPRDVVSDVPHHQKYFSTLDAVKGYWQVPWAEESQDLTTFITPWGRYKYLRAPMGLSSTGDVYNLLMDAACDGLKNQKKVVDDILLYENNFKDHVIQIRKLLQRFRDHGISVSKSKFNFAQPQVKYVGFVVKSDGVELDPTKVRAIAKFPTPTNLTELRSFMGLVNQMSGHSKEVSGAAVPLQPLMKKKNEFQWLPEHQEAMEKVKNLLTSPPMRQHFNPALPTIIECDAAK